MTNLYKKIGVSLLLLLLLGLWVLLWTLCGHGSHPASPIDQMEQFLRTNLPGSSFFHGIHTRTELFLGKQYVDGIHILEDTLVEELPEPDIHALFRDLKTLETFCLPYRQNTFFMAVPTPGEFYDISGYQSGWSQRAFIKDLAHRLESCTTEIDLYAALMDADPEDIYFKTQTLWNGTGAYLGYEAFASRVGLYPKNLEQYNIEIVSHDFRGELSRTLQYAAGGEDHIKLYYDPYLSDATQVKKISNLGVTTFDSVYFREFLQTEDQYKVFLGDPAPLTQIASPVVNDKKLLLFGDEYASVLAPYFLRSYSETTLVNLDLLTEDTAQQIHPEEYDHILFVYSTKTLASPGTFSSLELLQ